MLAAVAVSVAIVTLGLLLSPRVRQSTAWSATVTPLASIIGSGFLVSVPLLAHAVGHWALFAMAGLMLVSYAMGAVIRYNIRYSEPQLHEASTGSWLASAERISLLTLVFAYVISVAYYLTLLSAFLLHAFGMSDPILAKSLTTVLIILIAGVGTWRGLRALEGIEIYAVSFNLAIIAGLLATLAVFLITSTPRLETAPSPITFDWRSLQIILGLLIVVQGFETSKFLGAEYDSDLRIKTMRRAQWISGLVYLVFFALLTPLLPLLGKTNQVTAIITLVAHVAVILPFAITLGAIASQFSASVADSIGASGLLHQVSAKRIAERHAYPMIGLIGLIIVWEMHVTELIAFASRAFALFYFSQCVVAIITAFCRTSTTSRVLPVAGFSLMGLICLAVVLFGAPVEG